MSTGKMTLMIPGRTAREVVANVERRRWSGRNMVGWEVDGVEELPGWNFGVEVRGEGNARRVAPEGHDYHFLV